MTFSKNGSIIYNWVLNAYGMCVFSELQYIFQAAFDVTPLSGECFPTLYWLSKGIFLKCLHKIKAQVWFIHGKLRVKLYLFTPHITGKNLKAHLFSCEFQDLLIWKLPAGKPQISFQSSQSVNFDPVCFKSIYSAITSFSSYHQKNYIKQSRTYLKGLTLENQNQKIIPI